MFVLLFVKFCPAQCCRTRVTLMTATSLPLTAAGTEQQQRFCCYPGQHSVLPESWDMAVPAYPGHPSAKTFSRVLGAVGCSRGTVASLCNFVGVTFKLSVTSLSLEFFIVGIFVLSLDKLSIPRKHAVWSDLMLLEVFLFFLLLPVHAPKP